MNDGAELAHPDRLTILIVSDLVRLATQLTAGLLPVTGQAGVPELAGLAGVYGAADGFFASAFHGAAADDGQPAQPAAGQRPAGVELLGGRDRTGVGDRRARGARRHLRHGTFTLWETSLQEHVRDRALSRVSSYDYLTSAGVIPLGNVLVGAVGAALGVATLPPVRNLPRRVLGQRVARL
jgi:hypothetical protein